MARVSVFVSPRDKQKEGALLILLVLVMPFVACCAAAAVGAGYLRDLYDPRVAWLLIGSTGAAAFAAGRMLSARWTLVYGFSASIAYEVCYRLMLAASVPGFRAPDSNTEALVAFALRFGFVEVAALVGCLVAALRARGVSSGTDRTH